MGSRKMYSRLLRPPERSLFLFGMTGVGKSTWVKQNFAGSPTFDLLGEGLFDLATCDGKRRGNIRA